MPGSNYLAEIQLTHPELALAPTISECPDMEIELDYQLIADPETYYLFFEVTGDDFDRFDDAVERDATVTNSTVVIDADGSRFYRMELTALEQLVLPYAAELGMRVLHAESGDGGWRSTLEVPDLGLLRQFHRHCIDRDVTFSIVRLLGWEGDEDLAAWGLTPIQRETIVAAYNAGYFNEPRDTSLAELADQLGVSTSAVAGRLRRAVAALVANTVCASEDPAR